MTRRRPMPNGPRRCPSRPSCSTRPIRHRRCSGAGLARDLRRRGARSGRTDQRLAVSHKGCVVAVDVPSGVDGTTGLFAGGDRGWTRPSLSPGSPAISLMPARAKCGTINCAQIGIKPETLRQIAPQAFWNVPEFWRAALPVPKIDAHKYSRGHALVVSGSLSFTGAARLCAAPAGGRGPRHGRIARRCAGRERRWLTAIMVRRSDGPKARRHSG